MATILHRQTLGTVYDLVVDADPATGGGTVAPLASTAVVDTTGVRYHKTGAGDTAWVRDELAAAQYGPLIQAAIAVADVGAAGTDTSLAITCTDLAGTALSAAVEVLLTAADSAYGVAFDPNANISLSAVTAGAVVDASAAAQGRWIVRTDATGAFACTATNVLDETVWFVVGTALGWSSLTYRAVVVGCIPDDATWS